MQRVGSALLFLLLVSSVWAQSAMPGTFSTPSVQSSAVVTAPLLTPPLISFGSGLTPPVVVNGQAMVVGAPMSNLASPSEVQQSTYAGFINGSSGYVPMPTPVAIPVRNPGATSSESRKNTTPRSRTAYFEYVVAPSVNNFGIEETGAGVGDTNLGQMAASLRKGPLPTQRNFTNESIARLNGATSNNYQILGACMEQPQPQQHSGLSSVPLPRGAKPSAFSPDSSVQQTSSQQANATASETTKATRNKTPARPGSEARQSGIEASRASNQQITSESPSSAKASVQRRLSATSSFLPLAVLCGIGITVLGILFASRH